MRIGYEISQFLKDIKTQEGNDRVIRAMMVANALGYHFPIDPAKSAADNAEDHIAAAKKVISQINENLALDSKLAVALFQQVIGIRHELIVGVGDMRIIEAAMTTYTANVHQTAAETVAATSLVSNLEFMRAQNGIRQVLMGLNSGE